MDDAHVYVRIHQYFEEALFELKTKNRFTNTKLDRVVDALVYPDINAETLRNGVIFYRARKYTKSDAELRFLYHKNDPFQGYDKENSFVNSKAPNEGRCNPQFIPYLYASATPECCISEICPRIGEYISVATIRTAQPLRILTLATDCVASQKKISVIPGIEDSSITLFLTDIFSKRYEENGDYLLTQYFAEKIKNKGYDGISYNSSVHSGLDKVNYTIFNYNTCEVIGSKLYKITNITVEYSPYSN